LTSESRASSETTLMTTTEDCPAQAGESAVMPASARSHISRLGSRRQLMLTAAAVTLMIIAGLSYAIFVRTTADANPQPRRLAILPFRNLKPDAQTDF